MRKMTNARPRSPRRTFSEAATPPFAHEKARHEPGFFRCSSSLLLEAAGTEALLELVDAATGVQHLLRARVERVAGAADVQVDVLGQRGTGLDHVAAGAGGGDVFVLRVDTGFHGFLQRMVNVASPPCVSVFPPENSGKNRI